MNILFGIAVFAFGLGLLYLSVAQSSLVTNLMATEKIDKEISLKLVKQYHKASIAWFAISGIASAIAL